MTRKTKRGSLSPGLNSGLALTSHCKGANGRLRESKLSDRRSAVVTLGVIGHVTGSSE